MPKSRKTADQVAAENASGMGDLEDLQALVPPGISAPGAPIPFGPAVPSNRLHGKFAQIVWSPTSLLLCSEWEINYEQEFADGTAHGEYWDFPVPTKMMWTGRAQAYVRSGGPGGAGAIAPASPSANWLAFMEQNILFYRAGRFLGDPQVGVFSGYAHMPALPGEDLFCIFRANAYVSRSAFTAPKSGAATQEINLRGVAQPAIGFYTTTY